MTVAVPGSGRGAFLRRLFTATAALGLLGIIVLAPAALPAAQHHQVAAIRLLPTDPYAWTEGHIITFPCALNGHRYAACELDTGSMPAVMLGLDEARYVGAAIGTAAAVATPIGDALANNIAVTVGAFGHTATLQGIAASTWHGDPLIGLAAFQKMGITFVGIDLTGPSILVVDRTPQSR